MPEPFKPQEYVIFPTTEQLAKAAEAQFQKEQAQDAAKEAYALKQKGTSLRNASAGDPEEISQLLKDSPLRDFAQRLNESPYGHTIIGICWQEELRCTINPYGSNNFYGLMSHGQIIRYPSIDAGLDAIEAFLLKAEANGRDTIEELNGWYVVPASNNWLNTVRTIKQRLETQTTTASAENRTEK